MDLELPPIRALLIDISGTLLIGSSSIVGAAHALAKLRAAHIPFRLCSNTSKESTDAVHERMRAAGLNVRREELWTSIGALRAVLKEFGVKRPYMLLSQSAQEECKEDSGEEGDLRTFDAPVLPSSGPYDAVVVGLAPTVLDYAHLNTAFRILVGEDRSGDVSESQTDPDRKSSSITCEAQAQLRFRPPLIALHKARYLEASDHALSLGPGPFVHALEDAAQTSATVVGKPTRAFFEAVLRDLESDLDAARHKGHDVSFNASDLPRDRGGGQSPPSHSHRWEGVAVIGDDVHADLGDGAIELGLWRVLVKTGKYRPGDERRTNELPPDHCCTSFAEFVDALVEKQKTSS